MTYEARITALTNVREHPNADKLKLATAHGHQVVVGLDHADGDMGVFFPTDGVLDHQFCLENELYPITDENGNRIGGGFFSPKKARVRAQRFRGEKSEGFWIPLTSLAYTGVKLDDLHEGYTFDTINGQKICEKWYAPATLRAMQAGQGRARKENIMFAKHIDTLRYQYDAERYLQAGALVWVSEKLHGSSARQGYVLDEVEAPKRWYHKLFGLTPRVRREWNFVVGTRNIVLRDPVNQGFYEDDSFRFKAVENLRDNLKKGEIIYGEIVGWAGPETPIMARQNLSGISELKEVRKRFGSEMTYTYGCLPGDCEFYVYRITQVNEDGDAVELPWTQVQARCSELGIKTVPLLSEYPFYLGAEWTEADLKELQTFIDTQMELAPSLLDDRHMREGVVVRVECLNGETVWLKNKTFEFGLAEGYLKSNDEYVDREEAS